MDHFPRPTTPPLETSPPVLPLDVPLTRPERPVSGETEPAESHFTRPATPRTEKGSRFIITAANVPQPESQPDSTAKNDNSSQTLPAKVPELPERRPITVPVPDSAQAKPPAVEKAKNTPLQAGHGLQFSDETGEWQDILPLEASDPSMLRSDIEGVRFGRSGADKMNQAEKTKSDLRDDLDPAESREAIVAPVDSVVAGKDGPILEAGSEGCRVVYLDNREAGVTALVHIDPIGVSDTKGEDLIDRTLERLPELRDVTSPVVFGDAQSRPLGAVDSEIQGEAPIEQGATGASVDFGEWNDRLADHLLDRLPGAESVTIIDEGYGKYVSANSATGEVTAKDDTGRTIYPAPPPEPNEQSITARGMAEGAASPDTNKDNTAVAGPGDKLDPKTVPNLASAIAAAPVARYNSHTTPTHTEREIEEARNVASVLNELGPDDPITIQRQEDSPNRVYATDIDSYRELVRASFEASMETWGSQRPPLTKEELENAVNYAVEHERAHAKKALEHGLNVRYGVEFNINHNDGTLYVGPFVNVYGTATKRQIQDFLKAPATPSEIDDITHGH